MTDISSQIGDIWEESTKFPPEPSNNYIKIIESQGMLEISFFVSHMKRWYELLCEKFRYMTWEGDDKQCLGKSCSSCGSAEFINITKINISNIIDVEENLVRCTKAYLAYMMKKGWLSIFFFSDEKYAIESEHHKHDFAGCSYGFPDLFEYRRINFNITSLSNIVSI